MAGYQLRFDFSGKITNLTGPQTALGVVGATLGDSANGMVVIYENPNAQRIQEPDGLVVYSNTPQNPIVLYTLTLGDLCISTGSGASLAIRSNNQISLSLIDGSPKVIHQSQSPVGIDDVGISGSIPRWPEIFSAPWSWIVGITFGFEGLSFPGSQEFESVRCQGKINSFSIH